MSIESQQSIARHIYKIMEEVSSACVLVGGAPRDWYFEREASDLDFFFVRKENSEGSLQSVATNLNLCRKESTTEHHLKDYQLGPLVILEGCLDGLKIQLVEIDSQNVFELAVDQLHLSISKIVWLESGVFVLHPDFEKTLRDKTIYCKKGYDLRSKYAQKIVEKFKDMGFVIQTQSNKEEK